MSERDGNAQDMSGLRETSSPATGRTNETEEREVLIADPHYSETTNARLTEEVRAVLGTERVRVPAGRAHRSRGERPPERRGWRSPWVLNALFQLAALLVFAGVIALTGASWWLLPIVVVLEMLAVTAAVLGTLRLTTITEHPSPEVAAAMYEAGDQSPDEAFSRLVAEFRPREERGLGELAAPEHEARTVAANRERDPAQAGVEQASSWTATAQPSQPVNGRNPVDLILLGFAVVLVIFSLVIAPLFGGGFMWLLPAIMIPLVVAFAFAFTRLGERYLSEDS
jgi:Flp pilus assembly protein TadB